MFGPQRHSIVSSIPTPPTVRNEHRQRSRTRARTCPDRGAVEHTMEVGEIPRRAVRAARARCHRALPGASRPQDALPGWPGEEAGDGTSQCLRIGGTGNIEAISRCSSETADTDEELHHGPT